MDNRRWAEHLFLIFVDDPSVSASSIAIELANYRKEVLREEVARLRRDQSACNSMIASHMIWMANELERLAGEQEGK